MIPSRVIDEARGWVGVPFRHQGRDYSGIDCVGLPIVVGQSLGLFDQRLDIANYGRLPTGELGPIIGADHWAFQRLATDRAPRVAG